MCIWVSNLPLEGFILEASVASRVDPSRRFFDGGGEPADEVSGEGRASVVVRRGFRAIGRDAASVDRIENEFWVAILVEATGVANDTLLCFLGIFEHQNKGVVEGWGVVVVVVVVVVLFSGGLSGHVAGDRASHGAYAGLS